VDNIRMDLGEVGWGDVDWTGVAQDRNRWIRYWTFGFHEMLGNYLVASRVVLSSIELVSEREVESSSQNFLFVFWVHEGPPFFKLEDLYSLGTDLWWMNSWLLNIDKIHPTVQALAWQYTLCTCIHTDRQTDSLSHTTSYFVEGRVGLLWSR
jgi:hypothetical protein